MGRKKVFLFWFEDYKWFQYSKLFDGAFCLPCVISGNHMDVNSSKVDKLVLSPFIDWSLCSSKIQNEYQIKHPPTNLL